MRGDRTRSAVACRRLRLIGLVLLAVAHAAPGAVGDAALLVTTTDDAGPGSLREAILAAAARPGPDTIRFDPTIGPFAAPQTIRLASALPALAGELIIDGYIEGRLWKPTGVTVSGAAAHRVFTVAPGARVTISGLTVAEGRAEEGGGIASAGVLVVKGVTFVGNVAEAAGGGLANLGGTLTVINSTFTGNRAGQTGGGLAVPAGSVTVTNSTFSGNRAPAGGGLFSAGRLLLRNTILANSADGADCVAVGDLDPASTHNLVETNDGCGTPLSTADPRLGTLGRYNGPTPTLPLRGGSPAINQGDNASAVDERGRRLAWDQRGNGDPRFAGGITDLGAFERQALTRLTVDTVEDADLRGCSAVRADCSLRGALVLANARRGPDVITFDRQVFASPRTITLVRPLPEVLGAVTLDGRGTGGVRLRGPAVGLRPGPAASLTLHEVRLAPAQ